MLNKPEPATATCWQQACYDLKSNGTSFVLVTLLGVAGSTPRDAGTKMVITETAIFDTVGGGHLEHSLIKEARALLDTYGGTTSEGTSRGDQQCLRHIPLGASMGQCCGGSVTVLFEVISCSRLQLDVYGAGHVAKALMTILSGLPIQIRWIDSRAELLPEKCALNIRPLLTDTPVEAVAQAKKGTAFLVLTHDHQLDFDLTQAIIKQHPGSWLGVIGSMTKANRFRQRLLHRGFSVAETEQLTCPIGLSEIQGKAPMEVAVSVAGQLIGLYQPPAVSAATATDKKNNRRQGVAFRSIKPILTTGELTRQ